MTDEPVPAIARRAHVALRRRDGLLEQAELDALYDDVVYAFRRARAGGELVHLRATDGRPLALDPSGDFCITELKPEPWPW